MISRRKLDALVERVVKRLAEAGPAPATAKQGNFRYDASGRAVADDEDTSQVNPTAKTQMPPTQHPPTMPASRNADEQELAAQGGMGRNPQARPMSPKATKVNAIKKALDASGWTAQKGVGDNVVQAIGAWYDTLDPGDALVATAQQLAQRFSQEGGY